MKFFLFRSSCALMLLNALFVVISRNALHSILFLAGCFFFSSITIFLLEDELLSLFLLLIYLGAIIVLFLFVVMMLDLKQNILKIDRAHSPVGFMIIFFMFLLTCNYSSVVYAYSNNTCNLKSAEENTRFYSSWVSFLDTTADVDAFAKLFYTNFAPQLIISGVLLYISVIGVVFLTSNKSSSFSSKRSQPIVRQISRSSIL